VSAPAAFGLCLDLNVLLAAELSKAAGRTESASQVLVRYVEQGHAPLGPIQLVISQGMLERLEARLLDRVGITPEQATALVATLAELARLGPARLGRILPLGSGVLPLRDAEDRGVLETALAGKAHFLVTANWRDFLFKDVEEVSPGRIARYRDLILLHTEEAAGVLSRRRELPTTLPHLLNRTRELPE
jgi:predicted nucleic acid-binding protein